MKNFFSFLKIWIKKPKEVSAWFPTSQRIAQKVAARVPAGALDIVEYGPGPGIVAKVILSRLGPEVKFTVIEILPEFVRQLKKIKDPRLKVIEDDVVKFSKNLKEESLDVILSSIPLSRVSMPEREKLITDSFRALRPGGRLIVYYQNSRLILPVLEKIFKKVEWSFLAPNFTPYFIFVARK